MFKSKKGMIVLISVFVMITGIIASLAYLNKAKIIDFSAVTSFVQSLFEDDTVDPPKRDPVSLEDPVYPPCDLPSLMKGVRLNTDEELDLTQNIYDIKTDLLKRIVFYKGLSANTCLYESTGDNEIDKMISQTLKENGFYAFEFYSFIDNEMSFENGVDDEIKELKVHVAEVAPDAIIFKDYYNFSSADGNTPESMIEEIVALYKAIKSLNPTIGVGVFADPVRLNEDFGASYDFEALSDGGFDIEALVAEISLDCVIVDAPFALSSEIVPYKEFLSYWSSLTTGDTLFYTVLHNEKLTSGEAGWNNPVEIVGQIIESTKNENYDGFVLNDTDELIKNKTSTASLVKYINEDLDATAVLKELTLYEPSSRVFSTNEERILFRGTTDRDYEVLINGAPAARNDSGDFAAYVDLAVGTNRITFSHKGKTITYTITRTVNVLTSVSPTDELTLDGGTVLALEVVAYKEASVTATINGTTVKLIPDYGSTSGQGSLYCTFRGSYKLPDAKENDQNLGNISFYAYYGGMFKTMYGSKITVKKLEITVPQATGLIKLTNSNLPFTYSGESTYFYPCPDQVFLPAGTIDYAVGEPFTVKDGADVYEFIKTKSGKRFKTSDITYIPFKDMGKNSINSASCVNNGTYLTFKFGMSWNVPFNIQANGISYRKNTYQDFFVTSFSPTQMVITFNYTTAPADFTLPENGLFSSYYWQPRMEGDQEIYDLVLNLKNAYCYTGYVTSYDESGNLTIKFNLPLNVQSASNEYGGTLNGTVIAISAGHGGFDGGAVGTHGGVMYTEREMNQAIALKLKEELEKAGATVVLCNQVSPSTHKPDYRARANAAAAAGASIHIVIHQNSAGPSAVGFETYYYSPFSYKLGQHMQSAMSEFYKNTLYGADYKTIMNRGVQFSWISDTMFSVCPTVLLETGFISNYKECLALNDPAMQEALSKELVKGIIKYANEQN